MRPCSAFIPPEDGTGGTDGRSNSHIKGTKRTSTESSTSDDCDLLIYHDEIVRIVDDNGEKLRTKLKSLGPKTPPSYSWEETVWPEITSKIYATLEVTQTAVVQRERTFQFLGYDVLIDSDNAPWILEVNMMMMFTYINYK
jgi:hypothetical protein